MATSSSPVSFSPSASPPNNNKNATPSHDDDSTLMNDVRKLIFENCSDPSIWDTLAGPDKGGRRSTDRRGSPTKKRVTILPDEANSVVEDMVLLDIPTGLGLLFTAAQAERNKKLTPNLTKIVLLAAAPPPPEDPCHRLHDLRDVWNAKRQEKLNTIVKQLEEEEKSHCTFKPQISETAQHIAPKGVAEFYSKCREWKVHATTKLKTKAEREQHDKEEELMQQWKMNEKSKKILERKLKREQRMRDSEERADGDEQGNNEGAATSPSGRKSASPKFLRSPQQQEKYSFEPVTNSALKRGVYLTGSSPAGGTGSKNRSTSGEGGDADDGAAVRTTASQFVQRLQDDIKARAQRAEERKKYYEQLQNEQLYDAETGQPLFHPNALATKLVGKDRISFDKLSQEEQDEIRKRLKKLGFGFLAHKRMLEKGSPRAIEDIVNAMNERSKRATTNIDKIKRNEAKEQDRWFKPLLEPHSLKMAAQRDPPHKQPLPTKAPPPEPPKLHTATSAEKVQCVVQRGEQWCNAKKTHTEHAVKRLEAQELKECTFKPNREKVRVELFSERRGGSVASESSHHHHNNGKRGSSVVTSSSAEEAMVSAAEVRMRNELELLRNHPAYQSHETLRQGARSVSLQYPQEFLPARSTSYAEAAATETLIRHPITTREATSSVAANPQSRSATVTEVPEVRDILRAWQPGAATFRSSPLNVAGSAAGASPPPLNPTQSSVQSLDHKNLVHDESAHDATDVGIDELETLLDSWKELERETDSILEEVHRT